MTHEQDDLLMELRRELFVQPSAAFEASVRQRVREERTPVSWRPWANSAVVCTALCLVVLLVVDRNDWRRQGVATLVTDRQVASTPPTVGPPQEQRPSGNLQSGRLATTEKAAVRAPGRRGTAMSDEQEILVPQGQEEQLRRLWRAIQEGRVIFAPAVVEMDAPLETSALAAPEPMTLSSVVIEPVLGAQRSGVEVGQ
jgi:hypothetical protein